MQKVNHFVGLQQQMKPAPAPGAAEICTSAAVNHMVEVETEVYQSGVGHVARREDGLTPNGNPIGLRWVLRDAAGRWVDFNQYRHDLFEQHGMISMPKLIPLSIRRPVPTST